MTDMIELWHPIGAPKETFPETYPRVQQQVQKMFGPLMDQGVRYVAVSSQGNATKGGQITVTPMGGNTSEVIGILNMIRLELNAAKIVAEQDPEYRCPNFGSASRALRIRIPAQADR